MKRISGKRHRIRTYDVCKIYLFCFDDKRYRLTDGINSLAYFHKDIKSQLNQKSQQTNRINKVNKIIRIDKLNRINKINGTNTIDK